jgi:hypothetical protein
MRHRFKLIQLVIIFLAILLPACQEALPENRSFPIIRTLAIKNIDSSGATFQAELIVAGNHPTTSFGFIWDTIEPDIATANKIELGTAIPEGEFEKRIESMLAKDVEYKVRVYAVHQGETIYGNTITFTSQGSNGSGWALLPEAAGIYGGFLAYGGADNSYGYVLYQLGEVYKYEPAKNTVQRIQDFPGNLNSGANFTPCNYNGALYVFGGTSSNLYKLVNDSWSLVTALPFNYNYYNVYYQAFVANGWIHIVSANQSYAYDVVNNLWFTFPTISNVTSTSVAGTFHNDKAYLLMQNKTFWEYDVPMGKWTEKKEYPGGKLGEPLYGQVVSYAKGSKLFFGLNQSTGFWNYDTELNEWTVAERFPGVVDGNQFYFNLNGKLYVGIDKPDPIIGDFTMWSFEAKGL